MTNHKTPNSKPQLLPQTYLRIKKRLLKSNNQIPTNISNDLEYLFKKIQAIEQYFWESNISNNLILYQLILSNLKKKPNYHPLVSIIIPVYNGENFVREAIESALSQTYDNIEIIVVNDGSTDHTEDILKSYGDKISFYTKSNGGVSSALNFGIKKMHGDYFSWLSHDDLYAPSHIKNLVDWISYKEHESDIPFSMFRLIDENNHVLYQETITLQLLCSDFKTSYIKNELTLLEGEINGGSVLIPKKAFKECGLFDESLRISQERDMWARLIKKYHFVNIPFDTSYIRMHQKQVTNTNDKVAEESNQKNIEILSGLTDETINSLFSDKLFFYETLLRSYSNNSKKVLEEYVKNKITEIKNEK